MSGKFMVRHARRAMAIVAALALTLAVTVQAGIDAREREDEAARPLLYLPSGKYLRFVALGFDELLSRPRHHCSPGAGYAGRARR